VAFILDGREPAIAGSVRQTFTRADPEISPSILIEGVDKHSRKSVFTPIALKTSSVVTEKARLGTYPEKSSAILNKAVDAQVSETFFILFERIPLGEAEHREDHHRDDCRQRASVQRVHADCLSTVAENSFRVLTWISGFFLLKRTTYRSKHH